MSAAQYGHVIKHLEVGHVQTLPIPVLVDQLLADFNVKVRAILDARNSAHSLFEQAEAHFERLVGSLKQPVDFGECGYSIAASHLSSGRRRMDGYFHNPVVRAIRRHFIDQGLTLAPLQAAGFDLWLPTRFTRIPATDGVPFVDSSDLFEVNPDITKRIADGHFGDRLRGRVLRGWLLLARSGQIYGLNGSLRLANEAHEGQVVSDHIIRIAPNDTLNVRVGYVYVALSHPTLGRPLVKALAYGSSIPEIDISDMSKLDLVRLAQADEEAIADAAERGSALLAKADLLEIAIAAEAEVLIDRFLAGDSQSFATP